MALSTKTYDLTGNQMLNDGTTVVFDAQTNLPLTASTGAAICVSTVSPPTFSAPKGTLCLSTAGSSTSTRAYINTNGTTGWTAITTAS
jgi:hypothetical protein